MADSLKRKLKTKTIHEKYRILKEIERGISYASVAKNYNIPKQTYFVSLVKGQADDLCNYGNKFFKEKKTSAPVTV